MKKILFAVICCSMALLSQAKTLTYQVYYTDVENIRGELYQYSERYLGTTDVVTTNGHTYALQRIQPVSEAIQDTLLPAKKDGEYKSKTNISTPLPLNEETLMAANLAKKAESVAKQIYRIRETRMNILSGDVEHMPADGKAMQMVLDELQKQEKALTSMFVGTSIEHKCRYTVSVEVNDSDKAVQLPLMKFSTQLGPLPYQSEKGEMVTLNLICLTQPILAPNQPKRGEPVYIDQAYRIITRIVYNNSTIYEKAANL